MRSYFLIFLFLLSACGDKACSGSSTSVPPEGLAGKPHSTLQHDPNSISLDRLPKASSQPPSPSPSHRLLEGHAKEVIEKSEFTYVYLVTKTGEGNWVALIKTPIKKDQKLVIREEAVVSNFLSKSLGRTFDRLIFGTLAS